MRFHIETLGCKVNTYESQFYTESLIKAGYEEVAKNEPCDICIINSCTVTNTAASKSRQRIHHARKLNPHALIVVVGCYVQYVSKNQRDGIDADLIIGAKDKNRLVELIEEALNSRKKYEVAEIDSITEFESMPIHTFSDMQRAFLKVQDGCNQFCSYCAIPYSRGPERSLNHKEVLSIAKELQAQGHKEIVLTGIHTGRYFDGNVNLTQLLEMLLDQTNKDVYYRISSIEVTEVTDALIQLIQKNKRICRHLHIPIQAGCNETLARMNRPYTIEEFKERIQSIRACIPDISISTDVITGFVQESQDEFEVTFSNLKELSFSFLHVFPYSKRDGTKASTMKGEVHGNIQKERTSKLLELSSELRKKDMHRFDEVEVLVEREHNGIYTGYTNQYHPVRIESNKPLTGRLTVKVDEIVDSTYIIRKKA